MRIPIPIVKQLTEQFGGRTTRLAGSLAFALIFAGLTAFAQASFSATELDGLVARIALYPDALIAQVLSASTYPEQIEEAAAWADGHSYLKGDALADAINEDNLPWDPSVLSLLPFPSILDAMASNEEWVRQLGAAVFDERPAVLTEIQKLRHRANQFGYLRDGSQYRVVFTDAGDITIMPVDPERYYVPVYDPDIVFVRPRDQFVAGISFGPLVRIGTIFEQWGWRRSGFDWPAHAVMLDGSPWLRTRGNAKTYRHPYQARKAPAASRVERHELHPTKRARP
ncbi:MAG: DUF3300 domain-containing protein [Bryobacterales bacterium]|nr:DUF3300 domain-containing protein [Bryobacterales bacterium]